MGTTGVENASCLSAIGSSSGSNALQVIDPDCLLLSDFTLSALRVNLLLAVQGKDS